MPLTGQESAQEKLEREMQERRKTVVTALEGVSQAAIDLFCAIVGGDAEKRSATFWLETSFVYNHKYVDRLRKAAAEREETKTRKRNEELFNRYIAMTPPKSADELLTLYIRFGLAPAVALPANPAAAQATALQSVDSKKTA